MRGDAHIRPQTGPPVPISRVRLFVVFGVMLLLAGITLLRLIDIQLVKHSDYKSRATSQYTKRSEIKASRGTICDRQGRPLTSNLPHYWSVGVIASKIENRDDVIRELSTILEIDPKTVQSAIDRRGNFTWIKRKFDPHIAATIRDLGFKGVELRQEILRRYDYEQTGSQVIGYVDIDNIGGGGIEKIYDDLLTGKSGWKVLQKNAIRQNMHDPNFPKSDPVNGGEIILSIDINAQAIAEEELIEAVKKYDAAGGMIVVTRPSSGEIIAIASAPRFDPNRPGDSELSALKNKAVTDVYEPGSTFKAVSFAGLLEKDRCGIDELVFCENGKWRIHDRVIHDSHPHAWLTARQVLAKSSNIGTAKLVEKLTNKELYTIMRDFGFGQKSGVGIMGEVRGIIPNPGKWSGVSQSNIAMGHGIAITAIQLAMAYGAIANDGYLMKPIMVLSATDQAGNVTYNQPSRVRRVLKPSTARTMRHLLTDAVELGTGGNAMIEGLLVAGKTGTAQKVDSEKRTYYKDRYVGSFAGFLPADRPELLAVVVIEDPRNAHYGGTVAAPVFQKVMKRLLVTLPRQKPMMNEDDNSEVQLFADEYGIVIPAMIGMSKSDAESLLNSLGLKANFINEGKVVSRQELIPGTRVGEGRVVEIQLSKMHGNSSEKVNMPDVRGLTLRQAMKELTSLGIDVRIEGSGLVISQTLKPGKMYSVGQICTLKAKQSVKVSS
jgi:cell division protein FtsI/penicillin-binding protein 2